MNALGIQRATLLGHSSGTGKVTQFAHTHPERVDRLVYLDPVYAYVAPGLEDRINADIEKVLGGGSPMDRDFEESFIVGPDGKIKERYAMPPSPWIPTRIVPGNCRRRPGRNWSRWCGSPMNIGGKRSRDFRATEATFASSNCGTRRIIVSFSDLRPFLVLSPNSSRVRFRSVPNSWWATPTALSTVLEYLVQTHLGPRCRHEKRLLCPDDQLEKLSVAPLLEISSLCHHCPPPPDTACVPSP
jgi:pimeloyl-ACP methyl ester carboxylesterase